MALIVFLRGINVGGHRTFRPSMLARDLADYDVVNVGAAGTFVVRKLGSRNKFLADLRRELPFEVKISFCDASDLLQLEREHPFEIEPPDPSIVRFVSILSEANQSKPSFPVAIPSNEEWFVRIRGARNRLVFGEYRRHMKSIRYLSHIDDLFGAPATTRGWTTMLSVLRILRGPERATQGIRTTVSKKAQPARSS